MKTIHRQDAETPREGFLAELRSVATTSLPLFPETRLLLEMAVDAQEGKPLDLGRLSPASPCAEADILVINLTSRESECAVCGVALVDCRQGIPFYEGEPVPHDWQGDWIGRDACLRCFAAYESRQKVNAEKS